MPSALGYGLMGGALGALGGMQQARQEEIQRLESERLLQARAAIEEQTARIKAEYANAKDVQDHAQAKELKGMEVEAADRRAEESRAAADKRAADNRAASDKRAETQAAARVRAAEISASRKAGESSKAKPQLFSNDAGEQIWVTPGEDIPAGFTRAPTAGKPKATEPPKSAAPAIPSANEPPMPGARKAADGNWYVQQQGQWFKVDR